MYIIARETTDKIFDFGNFCSSRKDRLIKHRK
jgi:hypothetical protein